MLFGTSAKNEGEQYGGDEGLEWPTHILFVPEQTELISSTTLVTAWMQWITGDLY